MRMINLIVSIFGALMVIGGLYFMSLGFHIPPNPLAFYIGLIVAVIGVIIIIFFGSMVNLSKGAVSRSKNEVSPKSVNENIAQLKVQPKVKKSPIPQDTSNSKVIKPKPIPKKEPKLIKPIRNPTSSEKGKAIEPEKAAKPITPKKITPQVRPKVGADKTTTGPLGTAKPGESTMKIAPVKKSVEEKKKYPAPKSVLETADKERLKRYKERPGTDDEFVKNRLTKLKENYIENAKDIENILDERLDSFKGTIDKLKTDSKEPGIIWSFEAKDVQEAMKDTVTNAESRLLMMYPWIRNIDVGILKKFMDTESRMIIQEASLDDDASVELIKLLQEKDVQIRTMPHVHTVAIVSDDANGLIISTDPIYESYEVGVIYKDKKSIMEIERMFEDAWNISQEIDLGLEE